MEINKDFKEFLQLLGEHEVKYLVIGGYAVNFHGYPRYTKDIDLWVWMTKDNLQKLLKVIEDFGMGSLNLTLKDLDSPDLIIQLGYEPNRIDLLLDVEGLTFEDCFARRTETKLNEVTVNFLSISDLIIAKETAGRLQDLADAEQLKQIETEQKKK